MNAFTEHPAALGQWPFHAHDQQRFAALTGDLNPMHMDPVAARRLITGRPVVHGVHTLLAALERLPAQTWAAVKTVACDFVNPVSVGDQVLLTVHTEPGAEPELQVSIDGLLCTRIALLSGSEVPEALALQAPPEAIGSLAQPLDRPATQWPGQRQQLDLPQAHFGADFPALCSQWGERRVAAIGLLSTYVGMVCPGLHSVFAAVSLTPGAQADGPLTFSVQKYDPRYRLFIVDFDGPVRGQLRAFLRPAAQAQPDLASLYPLVPAESLSGRSAWVIGGSRGLGELAAKLAAAGGAQVALTFHTGAADAQRVTDEINQGGRGQARAWALDVMHDDWAAWLVDKPRPDAVFYFASPRIFRKKAAVLDAAQLQEFMDCYVHRFAGLCLALDQRVTQPVTVFVPSTVFIDERPRGMTEYAMAKAAAEVLAVDLGRSLSHVRFAVHRLPKLATDQTATVMGARTASNTEVLLPLVQAVLGTH